MSLAKQQALEQIEIKKNPPIQPQIPAKPTPTKKITLNSQPKLEPPAKPLNSKPDPTKTPQKETQKATPSKSPLKPVTKSAQPKPAVKQPVVSNFKPTPQVAAVIKQIEALIAEIQASSVLNETQKNKVIDQIKSGQG